MNDVTAGKVVKAKPEVEVVVMADGRLVEFAGKKQILKSSTVSDNGDVTVRFDFRTSATRTVQFSGSDPIIYKLAAHGAEQKLGDEMAASSEKFSLEDKIEWFDELAERLGDTSKTVEERWYAERAEGSGAVGGISVLVTALMELTGKTAEEVKNDLAAQVETLGVSKQQLVIALRSTPEIKPTIERIERERLEKSGQKIDVKAAMSGLGLRI